MATLEARARPGKEAIPGGGCKLSLVTAPNPVPEELRSQLGLTFDAPPLSIPRRIWPVGQLVSEVRNHIEREYADVWVEGEVSSLRAAPSGHLYFTLKDGDSQLPVVLFRRQALLLRFRPDDGMQALVRGRISVYEQRGQMQLIAEFMEPLGAGSLQLAFEQLRAKLQAEGLFDAERKRPLPAFPHCVGIVTSPGGAVIRDILNIVARRHSALHVLLYPVVVQGETAAADVAAGLAWFNKTGRADVVIIARGGGSPEDLAPFNSESLAHAIAGSEIPVVSAIGHETDFTIADFVADLRAPTPSAAAELITEAQHKVEERVELLSHRLQRAMRYKLMQSSERYSRLSVEATFARLRDTFGRRQQRVDELRFRAEAALSLSLRRRAERLHGVTARLLRQDASRRLALVRDRLSNLDIRLARAEQAKLNFARARHNSSEGRLHSLSPLAVLGRGYALVFDAEGRLLKDARATAPGQVLTARLARGSLHSQVLDLDASETPATINHEISEDKKRQA
ncbi:MAG TPA: exodeoxyribonuclease VII large subunit [Acidisarcina sp.]